VRAVRSYLCVDSSSGILDAGIYDSRYLRRWFARPQPSNPNQVLLSLPPSPDRQHLVTVTVAVARQAGECFLTAAVQVAVSSLFSHSPLHFRRFRNWLSTGNLLS
jgi:hypothetical protein